MFSLWPWPKVIQLRAFYFCWQIIIPHHLLDGIKKMRLLCFTTFIRKYVHSWKDTKIQFWLVNDTWMGGICSDWEIPHTFWFGLRKYSKITPNNKGGKRYPLCYTSYWGVGKTAIFTWYRVRGSILLSNYYDVIYEWLHNKT